MSFYSTLVPFQRKEVRDTYTLAVSWCKFFFSHTGNFSSPVDMSHSEDSLDEEKKTNPNLMADLFGAEESEGDSDSYVETSRPQRVETDGPEEESMSGEDKASETTPSLPLTQRVQESEPAFQRTVLTGLPFARPPANAEVFYNSSSLISRFTV